MLCYAFRRMGFDFALDFDFALTNHIDQLAELFKCDWSIRSLSEILNRFLALWTQGASSSG